MSALKPYSLVEFVSRGRKRKQRQVDVVPSKWIEFNKTRQRGMCKFLSAVNNEEDSRILHEKVKNLSDPPESWPSYSVNILGDAETYDKAVDKIARLEDEIHVFSLESGEELEERQSKVLEEIKRKKLLKDSTALDTLLNSPSKDLDSDDAADSPKSVKSPEKAYEFESDASDSETSITLTNVTKVTEPVNKDTVPVQVVKESVNKDTVPAQLKINRRLNNKLKDVPDSQNESIQSSQIQKESSSQKKVGATVNTNNSVFNLEVPVVSIAQVETTSEFQTAVLVSLSIISTDLQKMNIRLDNLEKYLCDKDVISTASHEIDFEAKYNFKLPIEDKPTFIKFNEEMSLNKYMKKDVIKVLKSCVDSENYVITKSMSTMLKKFITKAVALQYTAVRKSSKDPRDIFKSCEFCIAMEYVILTIRKEKNLEINDKLLIKGLSDVLCNAMNWDAKRSKK